MAANLEGTRVGRPGVRFEDYWILDTTPGPGVTPRAPDGPGGPRPGEPEPPGNVSGVEDWPEYHHLLGPEDLSTPQAPGTPQAPEGDATPAAGDEATPGDTTPDETTPDAPEGEAPTDPNAPENVIPGGSLFGHEGMGQGRGGHTLDEHVGRTPEELAARLAVEPDIPSASTYATEAEAEAAVARVLRSNQHRIDNWLDHHRQAGSQPSVDTRLNLRMPLPEDVGSVLVRGSDVAVPGRGAQVTLELAPPGAPVPYYITRSFPILQGLT